MTEAPLPSPSATTRRRATREREFRRISILTMVQSGWSYAAIGREEAISRERVRQIVAKAFAAGESETKLVPRGRRSPGSSRRCGLPRAASPTATSPRSTGCCGCSTDSTDNVADAAFDEGAREKLLAKLNSMAENIQRHRERHGDGAPGEDDSLGKDDLTIAALDAPQAVDS